MPIALWLCGAEKIQTYDLSELLASVRLTATLKKFIETLNSGILVERLPGAQVERLGRLASLIDDENASPKERLGQIGIEYLVQNLVRNNIASDSVDLIVSYAVFEYLDQVQIVDILKECNRILCPGGVMSHWIDMRDECAYFDSNITPYNFLRFSHWSWQLINNPLVPLNNRLRVSDFRHSLHLAGFHIVDERIERGEERELARVALAKEFQAYPKEDLLALDAWLVSVPSSFVPAPGPS